MPFSKHSQYTFVHFLYLSKKFSGFFLVAVDLPVSDAFAVSGYIVYQAANVFGREAQEASHFVRKVR